MKSLKLLATLALMVLLVLGLVYAPISRVRAQTAPADPDVAREQAAGISRLTGSAPAGGSVLFHHPDGSLEMYLLFNPFVQVAWFSPDMVARSAASAVSVTDAKTGYKTSLSPSSLGSAYRTVEVLDSAGKTRAKYDVKIQ